MFREQRIAQVSNTNKLEPATFASQNSQYSPSPQHQVQVEEKELQGRR